MAFVFTACNDGTGDQGDQGGQGDQGDQGDQGGGDGSVDGGDQGDQGDQGGEDDEGFNQEHKDSSVSVAGPEDSAANGAENEKDYTQSGK